MTRADYPEIGPAARRPRCCSLVVVPPASENVPPKIVSIRWADRDKKTIMADPYPIRPINNDEYDAFRLVARHAFNAGAPSEARLARALRQFEADRSLAAFDPAAPADAGPVGTAGAYSLRMTVPGAVLPVAGVTAVSVLPTHRRRGILRSLMHRQLADLAARGEEPIAALWASETPIYGRYGYGRATENAYFRFGRGEGALDGYAPADPALTLRLAEPGGTARELAKVYDAVLPGQPGFFARDDDWWGRVLQDESQERPGAGPLRCLLAEDGSGVRGYAIYVTTERWDDSTGLPDCAIAVRELVAADPAASAALWHNLLGRDLVTEVTAELRSPGDPLLFQLLDQRRARMRVCDGSWVRIIDLPAALTRRAYSCPVDVVLEVADEILPGNAGRWRLTVEGPAGAPGGVSCRPDTGPADLSLGIRELGAAYLGGTRIGALAAAGLVREHRRGALAVLSAAMSWDPAPWCPRIF